MSRLSSRWRDRQQQARNPPVVEGVQDSVWRILFLPLAAVVGGCATEQVTEASKAPAEQQLAVTKAVDHAVDNLKLEIAPTTKVFVDSSYVDTEDKGLVLPKYTIGAVRDLLLRAGAATRRCWSSPGTTRMSCRRRSPSYRAPSREAMPRRPPPSARPSARREP
jgi:hypothetical protein